MRVPSGEMAGASSRSVPFRTTVGVNVPIVDATISRSSPASDAFRSREIQATSAPSRDSAGAVPSIGNDRRSGVRTEKDACGRPFVPEPVAAPTVLNSSVRPERSVRIAVLRPSPVVRLCGAAPFRAR